jgi:hypothetical protein
VFAVGALPANEYRLGELQRQRDDVASQLESALRPAPAPQEVGKAAAPRNGRQSLSSQFSVCSPLSKSPCAGVQRLTRTAFENVLLVSSQSLAQSHHRSFSRTAVT